MRSYILVIYKKRVLRFLGLTLLVITKVGLGTALNPMPPFPLIPSQLLGFVRTTVEIGDQRRNPHVCIYYVCNLCATYG
ncbi:uncharacterized protein F4817DRAFT_342780 [Daldinia loculata]|uniref:uncharacterized protein n=1 Tax=Daldinia loculata TaxID=103429 RepID=UPI0020C2415D|nr:uncharacterized protein F4817DRAFT_342780 [Daldinia loculata]KAI1645705.1 hypothetical protein F4817DRAFT_342780 [Daldinia loculata]